MTCTDHPTPVEDCCGCAGRWDRAMAERALETYSISGIERAMLRMAIREIDRLIAALPNWSYTELLAQRDALIASDVAARAEVARLTTERLGAVSEVDQLRKRCAGLERMIGTERDATALRARIRSQRARHEVEREADLDEAATTYAAMAAEIEVLRCGDVGAFHDGELSPERAAAFRDHLMRCASCQREVENLGTVAAIASAPPREPVPR